MNLNQRGLDPQKQKRPGLVLRGVSNVNKERKPMFTDTLFRSRAKRKNKVACCHYEATASLISTMLGQVHHG